MRRHVKVVIVLIAVFNFQYVKSQESILLSKQEVLNKIFERNLSLKISKKNFNQAQADFYQTSAVFLPSVTVSHTATLTTNPLMAFGAKLNQGILTARDFNTDLLNNPVSTQNFATKVEIQQPLINLDGFYQRKSTKSIVEAMRLKTKRARDYLVLEVENTYLKLQLAHKGVEVLEKALKTVLETKKVAENKFSEGFLQKVDVLNVEVRVAEVKSKIHIAKSNVKNTSNYLSFLMNEKTFGYYKPSEKLTISNLQIDSKTSPKNRADIKAMYLTSIAFKDLNKADKLSFLPRLNAFGSYEMYENQLFRGNAKGYLIGAKLSWDVFKGSKKIGKVLKSKAKLEKSELEYQQYMLRSKLELNKVKYQLADAKSKLELTDLAVQKSKESLRIIRNRFKEGLEKTTDLLSFETQYLQKRLAYYQAIYEYNYTQAYFQFLTKE